MFPSHLMKVSPFNGSQDGIQEIHHIHPNRAYGTHAVTFWKHVYLVGISIRNYFFYFFL